MVSQNEALTKDQANLEGYRQNCVADFQANGCGGDVNCYADLGLADMNRRGLINCSLETKKDVSK